MAQLTDNEKQEIETKTKDLVEKDILKQITDGTLPNDVFNRLNDPNNNYYLDCSPTSHSADEITTYNVPINSEYTRDAARLDVYKTLVYLCIVVIFMIFTYVAVPVVYKKGIVDVINKMFEGDNDKEYQQRIERITTIDIILSLWMLGAIAYSFALSFSIGIWGSYLFVILLIVYVLSVVIIDGKKKETDFMTTDIVNNKKVSTIYKLSDKDKIDYLKNVNILDFVSFIADFVKYLFGYDDIFNEKAETVTDRMPQVLFIWIAIILVIYYPVAYVFFRPDTNTIGLYYGAIPFGVMFPLILYFCLLFDVGTEYRRKYGKNLVRKLVNVEKNVKNIGKKIGVLS